MSTLKKHKVEHDLEKAQFYIDFGGKQKKAVLCYQRDESANIVELWHTEVPVKRRGCGYAEQLAISAFTYFQTLDPSQPGIFPSCWYLRDIFLPKFPEFCLPSVITTLPQS